MAMTKKNDADETEVLPEEAKMSPERWIENSRIVLNLRPSIVSVALEGEKDDMTKSQVEQKIAEFLRRPVE